MNAIEISSINKTFTKKLTQKVQALDNVSFAVPEGKVFGFIGPNGAGKSTTIKILMGLLKPDSGATYFYGTKSFEPAARSRVGYLAENPAYYDYLTPRELLAFVGENFGMSPESLSTKIGDVLTRIDLAGAADRPIRTLSKGMVQRIGLGQTLIHDPDIFVLDEPMSGLDPIGRGLVSEIIQELKSRGKTVLFSTHIIHDVERICDDMVLLFNGTLKFSGSVKSVIDESFTRYEVILRKRNNVKDIGFPSELAVSEEGENYRVFIPKDSLEKNMPMLFLIGEILSIEPERRSLEQIFLGFVKSAAATERSE